jgi:hypothetical protein
MGVKGFKRWLVIPLAILAIVVVVAKMGSMIQVLSNRDMLYSFEARGVVLDGQWNTSRPSLVIDAPGGDGAKAICFSVPFKKQPHELRPGATFEKKPNSWTCRLDGKDVDLSGLLPRF